MTATEDRQVVSKSEIDKVWSGHPVDFCLRTVNDRQFVAYYDADRRMTVAERWIGSDDWRRVHILSANADAPGYRATVTSTRLGWDSHNSVTLAVDYDGYLHLSGNMHVNALTYFRSQRPWDINSFVQHLAMIGENEERCTYPRFLTDQNGELIFHYRDGSSGNGSEIYNRWDRTSSCWKRLLDRPLINGQGQMNAYLHEPVLGPDGRFHMSWVWRDTPDCSTNHDLSYAVSSDLVQWQTAAGNPIELPMTLQTPDVVVDPVPAEGGIINGSGKIGFDSRGRAILTYHKFDAAGVTQAYNARWEDREWVIYRTSNWTYRWWFEGGGSIVNDVELGRVELTGDGQLTLDYRHVEEGSGRWRLAEETLRPQKSLPSVTPLPAELMCLSSDFPVMQVRLRQDEGVGPDPMIHYVLRWETLPANRDQPRSGALPEPSTLQVYAVHKSINLDSRPTQMQPIYHITTEAEASAARSTGEYAPRQFDQKGFIHCSYAGQVQGVANRYYVGQDDLVLLEIDPAMLTCDVIDENLLGGDELFPHVYGRLPMAAVTNVSDYPCNEDGSFDPPSGL